MFPARATFGYDVIVRVGLARSGCTVSLPHLEQRVTEHVEKDCPGVRWQKRWAALGGCDYLDVFDAPDVDTALEVAVIVRSYGCASTELWPIVEWNRFEQIVEKLRSAEAG